MGSNYTVFGVFCLVKDEYSLEHCFSDRLLEQEGGDQQAGRDAVPAFVRAVGQSEIGVPEQQAPQRGQETVGVDRPTGSRYSRFRTLFQGSQPSLR